MQTSEEENKKIFDTIHNSCIECIEKYNIELDPIIKEYKAREEFWNTYIKAELEKYKFYPDRELYRLKKHLIETARNDLETINRLRLEKEMTSIKIIVKINKKEDIKDEN